MNNPNDPIFKVPPTEPSNEVKKSWLSSHLALGIIFVVVVLAAIVAGIYYWQTTRMIPATVQAPVHKDNWKVVSDLQESTKTFEMMYPPNYTLIGDVESSYGQSYFTKGGRTEFTIKMPADSFPKTNFNEGWLTVAENKETNAADCKKYANGESPKELDKTEKVHGMDFNKAEFGGAAAGNFYDTRLFRIFHGGICYEISMTLHTGNISNYPEDATQELNQGQAWAKLMAILNTLKFQSNEMACIQVITKAKNLQTGEVKDFPTPCDVPGGWKPVDSTQ
ncbi:MAG: hypothetical protein KW802_00075 [Candidatus Doudnabacteria bacterium]|nr:hypothetical protein [Candidatus Doudnabacteria bacterium]